MPLDITGLLGSENLKAYLYTFVSQISSSDQLFSYIILYYRKYLIGKNF